MEKKYLVLSDIHGNVGAFNAVMRDCDGEDFEGIILLGDLIDYGMRSNEIVQKLKRLEVGDWKKKIIVNIWGNHEKLIIDKDLERLSSDRGRVMAEYTAGQLSDESIFYIQNNMNTAGRQEFEISGLKCLAVHGSLDDCYWKAIEPQNVRGNYVGYDMVFGGHSHYSHCFTHFYPIENPELRNKKAVIFINPGSVGQPRNHNPAAQYAILDTNTFSVSLIAVKYDVVSAMALYDDSVDSFYRTRLETGV